MNGNKMSLRVIMGPMFSGKTSKVQEYVRKYTCLGRPTLVLTYAADTRYQADGVTAIINHDQLSVPARAVTPDGLESVLGLPEYLSARLVVLDEAQFFGAQLERFIRISVDGYRKDVVLVGLDSDADRRPFSEFLLIAAQADHVEKLQALCIPCGDGTLAPFTRSLKERANRVVVGGSELYQPVCRQHFNASSPLSSSSSSSSSSCDASA
jgi:thymidine kinase